MVFKRLTAEERETQAVAKAEAQEAARREKEWKAFLASPAGQARNAYERGDKVFQYQWDVLHRTAVVVPMVTATGATSTSDPAVVLNSVCNEGWELVNGSFVFLQTGAESRDKFMASGQQVAVSGSVIGYYLFKRCEENRGTWAPASLEQELSPPVHRTGRLTR